MSAGVAPDAERTTGAPLARLGKTAMIVMKESNVFKIIWFLSSEVKLPFIL
jgi:hypothetical protein